MKKLWISALLLSISTSLTGCGSSSNHSASLDTPTAATTNTSTTSGQAVKPISTASDTSKTLATNTSTSTITTKSDGYPAKTLPVHTAVGANFDWTQPSDGPYPDITNLKDIWIDCSLSDQRVRIMKDNQAIYTMITSSGMSGPDTETPTGTYYIQQERGTWFYNSGEQEGAEYWTSWKDHGVFLFHSVAMDQNQKVIPTEAEKLGTQASHGCFRLTIADAKWIYETIPTGTKVVVQA